MATRPAYPDLSEEEEGLLDLVRQLTSRQLREMSHTYEDSGTDPEPAYRMLAEAGLTGLVFDPEYGGGGASYRAYLMVIEEIAYAWVGLAIGLGVHTLCCDGIQRFGSDQLKSELLPAMLGGEKLGAYALSEPASGSDAASLSTKARKADGHYVIDGQKQFCTRGAEADHVLVMARTGGAGPGGISALIVDKGTPGFAGGKKEDKMGWRSSPTWELVLNGAKVPEGRLVGQEGEGFKVALAALDAGRLGIAACSIGVAQAAMDSAVKFASEREQFGRRIIDFQGVSFMLADMATSIAAGRSLYRHAALLKDLGRSYSAEASMAKLFCSDVAMRVSTDAVQVHGGYGYVEEYPVERYMREAKALQIVEGTNQIQRMVIGRHLGR